MRADPGYVEPPTPEQVASVNVLEAESVYCALLRVALAGGAKTMTRKMLLSTIALCAVAVVLVWIPYRIHIPYDASDLRSAMLGILLPLCLFATAAFITLGAPERVRATKG